MDEDVQEVVVDHDGGEDSLLGLVRGEQPVVDEDVTADRRDARRTNPGGQPVESRERIRGHRLHQR